MLQFVELSSGEPILFCPQAITVVRYNHELWKDHNDKVVEITTDMGDTYLVADSMDEVIETINAAQYVLKSPEILTAKVLATVDQIEQLFGSITPEQWQVVNEYIAELSKFVDTNL